MCKWQWVTYFNTIVRALCLCKERRLMCRLCPTPTALWCLTHGTEWNINLTLILKIENVAPSERDFNGWTAPCVVVLCNYLFLDASASATITINYYYYYYYYTYVRKIQEFLIKSSSPRIKESTKHPQFIIESLSSVAVTIRKGSHVHACVPVDCTC